MANLLLIRHTTPAHAEGLCYGHLDLDLASSYAEELQLIREHLAPLSRGKFRVYSSPLKRCRQLAEDLDLGPVCIDEDLREMHFGEWEGLLWDDIPREISTPWTDDFVELAPPGGESFRQVEARALRFLASLEKESQEEDRLNICVSHSGIIRALRCWDLKLHLDRAFDTPLPYGAIFRLAGAGSEPA